MKGEKRNGKERKVIMDISPSYTGYTSRSYFSSKPFFFFFFLLINQRI
jgi:alanine-alpha-ketoisovalerate/valine-pyruvate aminotransferase